MMDSLRRILVATDGSEGSLKAARLAIEFGAKFQAELLVAHVVDDEVVKEVCRALGKEDKETRETLLDNARKYVTEIETLARQNSLSVKTIVEHGTPHEAILKLAERDKADLLVMGKTGRRGLRRALAGSVTRRVIDLAEIPVLVVK